MSVNQFEASHEFSGVRVFQIFEHSVLLFTLNSEKIFERGVLVRFLQILQRQSHWSFVSDVKEILSNQSETCFFFEIVIAF